MTDNKAFIAAIERYKKHMIELSNMLEPNSPEHTKVALINLAFRDMVILLALKAGANPEDLEDILR
jgi:hypothetical protein